MPGRVYQVVNAAQYHLDRIRNTNEGYLNRIRICEQRNAVAIAAIQNSHHLEEQTKKDIIILLRQLEDAISQEGGPMPAFTGGGNGDSERMITKLEALTTMLQAVVVKEDSVENKARAMEIYLNAFKVPSSQITGRVKLGLIIGLAVVIFAAVIAAGYIIPLIPLAAAVGAGIAASALGNVITFGGLACTGLVLGLCVGAIFNPLCRLVQQLSDENKLAESLSARLSMGFFAVPVAASVASEQPPLLVDGSESERPLLQVKGSESEDDGEANDDPFDLNAQGTPSMSASF